MKSESGFVRSVGAIVNSLELKTFLFIVIMILAIIIIVFLLKIICIAISNRYVKKNKERLFNDNAPLSQKCKDLELLLLEQEATYFEYIRELGLNQTYDCSSSVVSRASNDIIKYIIKYSNIENDLQCLQQLDFCANYMEILTEFRTDMDKLYLQIKPQLPIFVRLFAASNKVPHLICDSELELTQIEKPVFCFSYVSPAGKSSRTCEIKITTNIIDELKSEISIKINKSGHSKAQRSAMTNDLREAIKKRDNYTCCLCGNSVFDEPNLLLEVDHIIPISKGGKTEAGNLQTLCWRCNRKKKDNL